MEALSLNPFELPFMVDPDSVCLVQFSRAACPSTLDLELHRGEGSCVSSSAGSDSGSLDTTDSIASHDGPSRITQQTGVTTFDDNDDNDDIHGGFFRDPMLGCHKLDQDLYDVHSRKGSYDGPSNMALDILFNEQSFTGDEVVDTTTGFTEAGADNAPLPIKLEQSVGPGRHYHNFRANGDETHGPGQVVSSGTQPNGDLISNMKSGLLQGPATGRHHQGFNTLMHCTRTAPASGPFISTLGKLTAVMSMILADMHEAKPAAIGMLIAAMDEDELAVIGPLLAARDEVETAAQLGITKDKSPPTEAYWKPSPSSSSTTRQTRMNEIPTGVIQRLMPRDGKIYFGMDIDSFARAKIDPDVTDCIRGAAIKAAKNFSEQNLGIAFAYDPSREVFSIRYDPGLDCATLADAFFPSDPPARWQVRVSSLADNRWVFEDHRKSMHRIFGHEFAHILGLRHHDAGSNPRELQEPSALWLGTRDGDCDTIMRTGVHSSGLRLSEEDFRVIREFYSKRNGALVGGVRIVDVDPDERLRDFLQSQVRLLNGLIRARRRQAQN